jgi:hypothetical protein
MKISDPYKNILSSLNSSHNIKLNNWHMRMRIYVSNLKLYIFIHRN